MTRKRTKRSRPTSLEGSYFCDSCGEEIVIPVDLTAGESQQFIEDCPVCCRPNVITIELDPDDIPHLNATRE